MATQGTSRRFQIRTGMVSVLLMLLLCAGCKQIVQPPSLPPPGGPHPAFSLKLEALRKACGIPGMSVAVLKDQQVIFAAGFGYGDIEKNIKAGPRTPYNIASLTKPFAAAVLMKLIEQGRLDLDTPMSKVLSDTQFFYKGETIPGWDAACARIRSEAQKISPRHAGLVRNYRCDSETIRVRHHLTHTSQGTPGKIYRYNGYLYSFLTDVMQEVSGKQFDDLLIEYILSPLNMNDSIPAQTRADEARILDARARYYKKGPFGRFVPSSYPVTLSASAGMVSTVLDLAQFDRAMDDNRIVSAGSKAAMFAPTLSNSGKALPYGLGWFVQELKGKRLIWHYGWAPDAYSSLILKVPDSQVSFILLANSDGASAPFALSSGNVRNSPFATAFLKQFAGI